MLPFLFIPRTNWSYHKRSQLQLGTARPSLTFGGLILMVLWLITKSKRKTNSWWLEYQSLGQLWGRSNLVQVSCGRFWHDISVVLIRVKGGGRGGAWNYLNRFLGKLQLNKNWCKSSNETTKGGLGKYHTATIFSNRELSDLMLGCERASLRLSETLCIFQETRFFFCHHHGPGWLSVLSGHSKFQCLAAVWNSEIASIWGNVNSLAESKN